MAAECEGEGGCEQPGEQGGVRREDSEARDHHPARKAGSALRLCSRQVRCASQLTTDAPLSLSLSLSLCGSGCGQRAGLAARAPGRAGEARHGRAGAGDAGAVDHQEDPAAEEAGPGPTPRYCTAYGIPWPWHSAFSCAGERGHGSDRLTYHLRSS